MRFNRYPKTEPYQVTPRKLAARGGLCRRKRIDTLCSLSFSSIKLPKKGSLQSLSTESNGGNKCAIDAPSCGDEPAKLYATCPQGHAPLSSVTGRSGPSRRSRLSALMIHNHKVRKVCYWHVMAELRRLSIRG